MKNGEEESQRGKHRGEGGVGGQGRTEEGGGGQGRIQGESANTLVEEEVKGRPT